ncbi:hypothetical protein PSPO01_10884 [Paraphaeosphaeria sporulosa]
MVSDPVCFSYCHITLRIKPHRFFFEPRVAGEEPNEKKKENTTLTPFEETLQLEHQAHEVPGFADEGIDCRSAAFDDADQINLQAHEVLEVGVENVDAALTSFEETLQLEHQAHEVLGFAGEGIVVSGKADKELKKFEAEKNHLATQNTRLRTLLAENDTALPTDLAANTSTPSRTGTGSMTQMNQIISSSTVNNYNYFSVNPNSFNPISDPPRQNSTRQQNLQVYPGSRECPCHAKCQDKCTRWRCTRLRCEFAQEVQRKFYMKALNKLPFKTDEE